MEISKILKKYDTDKIWHHRYGDVYDKVFNRFDRTLPLNILEIGTQKGGSLLAWKEYFPNANVIGLDIVDVVPEKYRLDTVTRIISDVKDWKTDLNFDIVIDDGSHYIVDVAYVISQYCTKIKSGGVLIIEDVRNPSLLLDVISDLLTEYKLGFPNYSGNDSFKISHFDNRIKGAEQSYIILMIKD